MTLHIQDPGNENTAYLIDEIIAACRGASNGGGIFAFASVSGIRLLLENEEFNEFLESGAFHLVVGLDAVTNEKAVQLLREMDAAKGGLTVSAFLNPRTGALFHPKMSWFMHPTGGSVIVGSGNLTSGGLRDNWESFAVLSLSLSEIELAIAEWDEWFLTNGTAVLSIHEPEVLKRALLNRPIQIAGTSVQLSDDPDDGLLPALTPSPDVLVAEIPKGARWKQAGFSRSVFTGFFGATPGDLILDPFLGSGTTGAVAHKMGRRFVGIESGHHAATHAAERLRLVVDGERGGISDDVGWVGGGGFQFWRASGLP